MKKIALITLLFIFTFSIKVYGEDNSISQNELTQAYENKNVTIKYNDKILSFYTSNKEKVYPLTYNDSTYLPIRAISSLYYVPILWDGLANSIYLNSAGQIDKEAYEIIDEHIDEGIKLVDVIINKQIKIIYNNLQKNFYDINDNLIYPISYNNTTYLPIRSIANLFGCFVDYDYETNTVLLGNKLNIEIVLISGDFYSFDDDYDDNTEFTYMLTNYKSDIPISGDIFYRVGVYNDSLCWGINLYEEDPVTGKNVYEEKLDLIYDEIDEKASGDQLTSMLLIQKYNLDHLYPEYYEPQSGDYYFHLNNLYIVNANSSGDIAAAKTLNIKINDDFEKEIVLQNSIEPQQVYLDYYQYDITKTMDIYIKVIDAYEEGKDVYIMDITPYLESNIPQGR